MDARLLQHVCRLFGGDGENSFGADARRLWQRIQRFLALDLLPPDADQPAMELAAYALQLPMHNDRPPSGRLGQVSLRDRAEQAAELLLSIDDPKHQELIDRATRLLRELPLRKPPSPETQLLADALNLEDFGAVGLFLQAMNLSRMQGSIELLAEGFQKRQEYGYWQARLKDGFHFEPVRRLARQRLANAEEAARLLLAELQDDRPS